MRFSSGNLKTVATTSPLTNGTESSDSSVSSNPPSTVCDDGKMKKRCQKCSKRVGLLGFNCRCGGLFCSEHRYDSEHECTFDYKSAGREELRKKNPLVISEKIQKI